MMRSCKWFLTFILMFLLVNTSLPAFSDSVWERTSTSPYSPTKAYRVGDIVTIIVLETTSAVQKSGTDTNVSDSLSTSFDHTILGLGIAPSNTLKGSLGNTYKGLGQTSRSSSVTAKVASVVTKVMPNGNLMIVGEHKVEVNSEEQTISITGVIRPKDISIANTVFSYQVAQANVSVRGRGTVGDAEQPGFISRFFNWLF